MINYILSTKVIVFLLAVVLLIKHITASEKFPFASLFYSKIESLFPDKLPVNTAYNKIRLFASVFIWSLLFTVFGLVNYYVEAGKKSRFFFPPFREEAFVKLFLLLQVVAFYSLCALFIAVLMYSLLSLLFQRTKTDNLSKSLQVEIDIAFLAILTAFSMPSKYFHIIKLSYIDVNLGINEGIALFVLMISTTIIAFYSVSSGKKIVLLLPAGFYSIFFVFLVISGINEKSIFKREKEKPKKILILATGENLSPQGLSFYGENYSGLQGWGKYIYKKAVLPSVDLNYNIYSLLAGNYSISPDAFYISKLKNSGYKIIFISFRDIIDPPDEVSDLFHLSLLPPFRPDVIPLGSFAESFGYLSNLTLNAVRNKCDSNLLVWVHYPPLLFDKKGDVSENNKEYKKAVDREITFLLEKLEQVVNFAGSVKLAFTSLDGEIHQDLQHFSFNNINIPFILFELGKSGIAYFDYPVSLVETLDILTDKEHLLKSNIPTNKTVYSCYTYDAEKKNGKTRQKINIAAFDGKYFISIPPAKKIVLDVTDIDDGKVIEVNEIDKNVPINELVKSLNSWKKSEFAAKFVSANKTPEKKKYKHVEKLQYR